MEGYGQGCPGPGCLHLSLQDEEGTDVQKPEGCSQPAEPLGRLTLSHFCLLFSPTEPLGAKASTDNSDHLILNKVFLAGN